MAKTQGDKLKELAAALKAYALAQPRNNREALDRLVKACDGVG